MRMSREFKNAMMKSDSHKHIKEFEGCIGIVHNLVDYGTSKGPEDVVDVVKQQNSLITLLRDYVDGVISLHDIIYEIAILPLEIVDILEDIQLKTKVKKRQWNIMMIEESDVKNV